MKGKVYIVGAGPGDPELLTIKARKLIKSADIILYDHLVSDEIMKLANPKAEKIYVGKQKGKHIVSQDEINMKLIKLANEGKTVVRLKGGDPSIFGRAGEEIETLLKNDIEFEVVPGITSASAAAAKAKISLTHREVSSVLSFVTGHRKKTGNLDLPFKELVDISGTIVIYMGTSTASDIATKLIENGADPHTPVLIASNITLNEESIIKTTLLNLKTEKNLPKPAVIIIGNIINKFYQS